MSMTIAPFPKDSSNGFSVVVTAEAKPGKADALLEIFQRVRSIVSAEPECVLFELFRTDENPNKFVWFETWTATVEWFMQDQVTKPYMKAYEKELELGDILVGGRDIKFLERLPVTQS
ncbi:hypothetical protein RB595_010627 [Gaeumannomyces hyphopodioides]